MRVAFFITLIPEGRVAVCRENTMIDGIAAALRPRIVESLPSIRFLRGGGLKFIQTIPELRGHLRIRVDHVAGLPGIGF